MSTVLFLMAQYGGKAIIKLEDVCRDYFPHLKFDQFARKLGSGEIKLPVTRMDASSQKSAKGVHMSDLAQYIEERREAALKEQKQLSE